MPNMAANVLLFNQVSDDNGHFKKPFRYLFKNVLTGLFLVIFWPA